MGKSPIGKIGSETEMEKAGWQIVFFSFWNVSNYRFRN
jgi:hypothetical protein